MKNVNYVHEISDKYGYNDDLQAAILLTIPLMIKKYGEDSIDDIYELFRDVRIFATEDMSRENSERIEEIMLDGINRHIIRSEEEDPYQNDDDPGSYYSYQAVYDDDMNVLGEVRWIVIKDMKKSPNSEYYKELFGTTINIPYFIHEINHAFGMQNAMYRKEENRIISKHGMIEEELTFIYRNEKVEIIDELIKNVIIEEIIAEKISQDMLVDLMHLEDYSEVENILAEINHISTAYPLALMFLAGQLENVLGKENLSRWRRYNDNNVLQEFNKCASLSDIAKKYFDGEEAYEYFDRKCFDIFLVECNNSEMSNEDYERTTKEFMMDAFSSLCAYRNIKYGTMSLDKFDKLRIDVLEIPIKCEKKDDVGYNKKL